MKGKLPLCRCISFALVGTLSTIWILFLMSYIRNYCYLYPTIRDGSGFLSQTVLNIIIPLVILVGIAILLINRKYIPTIIFSALLVPILVFVFLRSSAEMLFSPTVVSYTTNPAFLGEYDKKPTEVLSLNPVFCFPVEIDENSQDVRYCYYYESTSSETLYIALSWRYDSNEKFTSFINSLSLLDESMTEKEDGVFQYLNSYHE